MTDPWWQPFALAEGEAVECAIGTLTVLLARVADAWLVRDVRSDEREEDATLARCRAVSLVDLEGASRFVFAAAPATVVLRPLLADRPVVVRPRVPVSIPPGERTTFYISTPVWVAVEVGDTTLMLRELPSVRMSDTWFGPNTREGELCYAMATRARSRLDEIPRRVHRIVTPVEIRNESSAILAVERLSLPVPRLSVYGGSDGSLWTQAVTLLHRRMDDLAEIEISDRPPIVSARAVSGPRVEPGKGALVRAFGGIFAREED